MMMKQMKPALPGAAAAGKQPLLRRPLAAARAHAHAHAHAHARARDVHARRHHHRKTAVAPLAVLAPSTQNPAFTGFGQLDSAMREAGGYRRSGAPAPMTLTGTVNKTALLLVLTAAAAAATWAQLLTGGAAAFPAVMGATRAAGMVAFGAAIASMFKPLWSRYTAPVYAVCKGVAVAGVSVFAEAMAPGVALNALLLTLATAGSLLFSLKAGLIRITDQFSDSVRAVSGGFFLAMAATFLLSLVGVRLPGLFASGPVAVVIGLVSAGLAAANLLLDFDYARSAARAGVPSKLEWYFAQSTLFTLVWMYMSILRLLMVLGGVARDD